MIKTPVILLIFTLLLGAGEVKAQSQQLDFRPVSTALNDAGSISITPSGLIYIVETNRHRMLVLSSDGERIDSLGSQGRGDYRFNRPVSIDATNGLKIYVADRNNGRVQLFDRRLQYLSSITSDKIDNRNRFQPAQLVVSKIGDLIVYDSDQHLIHIFDPNGNYSRAIDLRRYQIGSNLQLKISDSILLFYDPDQGVIHRFSVDGGYLNFIGGFKDAMSIYGSDSNIWAVYADRIVRHTRRGEPVQTYKFNQSLPVKDLSIFENTVFLLTARQLLKADLQ